ncbi:hypothetical protein, partial [Saccharothrix sp. ST-888]|uniref:hypothetical protein n=1 Tax=Saccharothrix sp. ST-888 TaxID=1427391 RepID=UPI000B2F7BFF
MNVSRRTLNSLFGKPASSQDRIGVDNLHDHSGASDCIRRRYGGADGETDAQGGGGEVVLWRGRARRGKAEDHCEGAALQEKPNNLVPKSAADE